MDKTNEKTQTVKYSKMTIFMFLLLIFFIGGVFGFIYEEIFYLIDLGYLVKRGATLGPYIPLYGLGALLIISVTFGVRKKPILVFLFGGAICGTLEYFSGYFLYHYGHTRPWNYNEEIWNWGNIGGYICIRSVLFFAFSSLILIYIILPFIQYLERKMPRKWFYFVCISTSSIFLLGKH